MDNTAYKRVEEFLAKSKNIGILTGKDPSLDEMGAALALYLSLVELGKSVSIASPSNPRVGIASLVGIDKVKTVLSAEGGDLIVSFPYKEGEIEKVSYTLDNGSLNIVVKPGEKDLSFSEKDVKFSRSQSAPELLFVVGVAKVSDLGSLFDSELLKDTTLVNIDNKVENQGFGDIVLVSPKFSSVSEQMTSLMFSLNLNLDIDISQNLLSGIVNATNNFQDDKTSPVAFEMASYLIRQGASRANTPSSKKEPLDKGTFSPKKSAPKPEEGETKPPTDWLAPKIYKGSTDF
jgi:nanoRNase/pAp phosphatase (c-di-AMP/oligoRNAs hydrolase)